MGSQKRADLFLVDRGFYESRTRAQAAIAAGLVRVNGEALTKASQPLDETSRIEAEAPHPFVSRGGVKLATALDHFAVSPCDRICLDIGSSTGGFTDCLLQRGARTVHAIDVGRDQFHASLRSDPRIRLREACDARELVQDDFDEPPSLLVIDVSFISLKLVLPATFRVMAPEAHMMALIKPQFEVGRAHLKKGIVRDEAAREAARDDIVAFVKKEGWTLLGVIDSPIAGGDGNHEYLVGAVKRS